MDNKTEEIYLKMFWFSSSLLFFLVTFQCCHSDQIDYCSEDRNCAIRMKVGWQCVDQKCQKTMLNPIQDELVTSFDACIVKCNSSVGSLWPMPTGKTSINGELVALKQVKISYDSEFIEKNSQIHKLLHELEHYAMTNVNRLFSRANKTAAKGIAELNVSLQVQNSNITVINYETDESYTLSIKTQNKLVLNVVIKANTYFGVRHGVETLLQLMIFDVNSKSVKVPNAVEIADKPVFKHRGVLIQTGHTFLTVDAIKSVLDGMAMNKLNTLHWEIVTQYSFPFLSRHYPEITGHGAYSAEMVYTCDDIEDIVHYARVRGVRVIPEFNAPGRITGWKFFNDETDKDVVICGKDKEEDDDLPNGVLNPINDKVYIVLKNLFEEFNQLFQSDVFHLGGDWENYGKCWKSTPAIGKWLKKRNLTEDAMYHHFLTKEVESLDQTVMSSKKQKIILWHAELTKSMQHDKLDKNRYIIQLFLNNMNTMDEWMKDGFDIILSPKSHLSFLCGIGSSAGCSPYNTWDRMYNFDPRALLTDFKIPQNNISQILGLEAVMLGSARDKLGQADLIMWPRGAALAERSWNNPTDTSEHAETRFLYHRERMVARGINADQVAPLWCMQNEGKC